LLEDNKPGETFQYNHHYNDIIATLESLLDKVTEIKNRLDMEEFEANNAFEKKRLALEDLVKMQLSLL